ncbi:MAG: SMC-Scp complex subunit ScpB [Nanoarchaeota archaeon]|nr:SMC-Scp complex subunit ScpB [Nanoarchaeota archaeon]MBU4241829.1 SMC-Scp complex subunit ScpB [Nanoarchaeota archaeon]MBU4351926.1 SMC-Scp complex subunit ScpB [Nanoarchaeota archaeon]MBU4456124.1 SMC-Scp complex subunit ScpB [Nanoarchaeota archaeon]
MEDVKNRIEAILFTTGRFMDIEEVGKLTGIGSIGIVKDALKELIEDYKNRSGSLEISEENNKFKLAIKKDYIYLTAKLLNDSELDRPTQETLAIIAYKQPVLQAEVVKIRGNNAYDHIKILKENEFITSEKCGRTRMLKLTSKFYDYFDTTADNIKGLKEGFSEVEQKVGIEELKEIEAEVQKELKEQKVKESPEDKKENPE